MNHRIAHRGLHARLDERAAAPVKDGPVTKTVVQTIVKTAIVTPSKTVSIPPILTPIIKPPPVKPVTTVSTSLSASVVVITPTPSTTSTSALPSTTSSVSVPKPVTTPKPSTSTTIVHPSATSAAANATGAKSVNGGAIAGGVIGGLLGAAALGVLVFFLLRRYRRKMEDKAAFSASTFRRSALLLTDPPAPPEKDFRKPPSAPSSFNPQQMIQVPPTSPASPYADSPYYNQAMGTRDPYGTYAAGAAHYQQSQYGADGQMSRDPFAAANNQYGGNISGATFGHANYAHQGQQGYYNGIPMHTSSPSPVPTPTRSPVPASPYNQPQRPYGQQPQYAQQHHQELDNAPLPNPFAAAQAAQAAHGHGERGGSLTTAAHALAAARIAAASARVGSTSPGPTAALTRKPSTGAVAALERANSIRTGAMLARADSSTLGGATATANGSASNGEQWATANQVLSRSPSSGQRSQRSESPPPPAYQDTDGKYANLQRDVKVAPNATLAPAVATSSQGTSAAPAENATKPKRPLSSHTVYDPADAYGGF